MGVLLRYERNRQASFDEFYRAAKAKIDETDAPFVQSVQFYVRGESRVVNINI